MNDYVPYIVIYAGNKEDAKKIINCEEKNGKI